MARKAGWRPTAKALGANNTCKACGLGMGGQRGGMTNELGEFPSVCNKSVQAQSSDLQPPIPTAIFQHTIDELKMLTELEFNQLGRLDRPVMKKASSNRFDPVTWEQALSTIAAEMQSAHADRTFFYSSGRSSNEAGFILQLFARLYGTNNVNNCSYYCHQATTEALSSSIGTGTATVELADLKGADCIFLAGANPASNHPRFIYELAACRERGGEVIVINPAREPGLMRFAMPKQPRSLIAGGSEIATDYLQPNIGTDNTLFKGIAKAIIENDGADTEFMNMYTAGADEYISSISMMSWDEICNLCGVSREDIERVAAKYLGASNAVFAWGMGLTHHLHGVTNIEQFTNLALLRGMIGRPHAGLLPLRGHSNVQGIGTIGVKPVLARDVFEHLQTNLDVTLPVKPGLDTMACLKASEAGNIDLALFMGGNLFSASPDSAWTGQALERIRTKIHLTTTLNCGHVSGTGDGTVVILPVCARDEEWQSTTQESMFNYVRMSDGGIKRHAGVRPETDILCDLAERVVSPDVFDFSGFRKHTSIRQAIAASVPGMGDLADIDVARKEFHVRGRLMHTPEFHTADGKAHFRIDESPQTEAELFPYTLATIRSEGQFNTIVYEENDTYRGVSDRWTVLMSKDDMERLDIQTGQRVTLRSEHGTMADVAVKSFELTPGNLMAYFPEANILVGTRVDPRSRTPAFKSVPVAVITSAHTPGVPRRSAPR